MIAIKPGVRVHGIRTEIHLAISIIAALFDEHGFDTVVTSVIDGKHSAGSLHYVGQAIDIRSRTVPVAVQSQLRDEMAKRLGGDFDVIVEKDHYHIEFQPKSPYE